MGKMSQKGKCYNFNGGLEEKNRTPRQLESPICYHILNNATQAFFHGFSPFLSEQIT